MNKIAFVVFASFAALSSADALAETQSLTCAVGKKTMTLVYKGDAMSGTLTAKTPWGNMTFLNVTYAGGDPAGEFTLLAAAEQPAVVMPDLKKLEACLHKMAKSTDELMDLTTLQIDTEACAPKIPDGGPVPATVEINVSVMQDYGVTVDVYRTYAAESPVADGHIALVLAEAQKPVCTVDTQ